MLEFIRRNFRWIAGGFMLTYFSSFGQTYFISASVSEWQAAFGLLAWRIWANLYVRYPGERTLSSVCWQAGRRCAGPSHDRSGGTCSGRGGVTCRLCILLANTHRRRFSAAAVRSGHDDAHSADLDRALVCCRAGSGRIACRARPPGRRGHDPISVCSAYDCLWIPCRLACSSRRIAGRRSSLRVLVLPRAARTSRAAVHGDKDVA